MTALSIDKEASCASRRLSVLPGQSITSSRSKSISSRDRYNNCLLPSGDGTNLPVLPLPEGVRIFNRPSRTAIRPTWIGWRVASVAVPTESISSVRRTTRWILRACPDSSLEISNSRPQAMIELTRRFDVIHANGEYRTRIESALSTCTPSSASNSTPVKVAPVNSVPLCIPWILSSPANCS